MLTLERMGIRTPSVYVAAAQQAERLTALDSTRGSIAIAQFQGSLALLARMSAVRTVDAPTGERLVRVTTYPAFWFGWYGFFPRSNIWKK